MAKKRIPEVIRDGSEADFIPENFMLIDGAEGSAKMRMDLFGKASSIEDLDEAKYEKPEGGIPKDDLSEAVQGSLELADSALQASDIEGKAEKSEMSITNVPDDTTKKTIQLKDGLSHIVVVDHQDISGKAEKSEMSVSAVSGDDTKKTIQLKSGLTQNVVIEHQDITGKADTSAMSITDVSGDVTKKTIQLNTGLSQDVVVAHRDISGKADKSEMSISAGEDGTKRTIQLKNGTSQSVVVSHQDISGKAEKSEMSVSAVSGDATKKTVTLMSGLSVDVVTDHKAELPTEGKAEGKVLTINDSGEVVWGDAQGGGSDLPPITPSDEGKFLKVESGAAAWSDGGGGDDSVTINIGDILYGMPADTGMWDKIAEPLFNDKTLHIVASFGGSPIDVKLTETTSIKQIKENFPQIATFADLKQFIEQNRYSRYVTFVLTADISGAGFTASVGYSTGFTPDKLLGIDPLTKAGLASNWDGTRYLDITMMCGYYKFDTSDNIWNFIRGEFFLEKDEEDPSIVEPLAIVYASDKKNFDVMYVGEMGALTEATAGNTIYSTDDSEEREWLQGHVNISMTVDSGKPVYKITVRVNGLASKCDSNGNQLPDTPQVPIMWRGIFEWGFKDGIYCYRCTDEQLVALSPAQ